MYLELSRCVVRSFRPADAVPLARNANDRDVWLNLRDRFPHPYELADAEAWIAFACTQRPETNFAIAVDDVTVGGIGFDLQEDVHRLSAEIGYWLGKPSWGRGIATEALRAVSEYALVTHQLQRLYAAAFAWNPPSMRVLQKAGYTREGVLRRSVVKDGRVIDQVLYALTRGGS